MSAYGTVRVGLVTVHAKLFLVHESVSHQVERDFGCGASQAPASASGSFGGNEAGATQMSHEPPNNDGVGTDGGGQKLGGETVVWRGSQKAEYVDGE